PRNSVALKRVTPPTNSSGMLNSQGVAKMATMNGTTMPETDTATAPFAFDLKSSLRKSSPTRNMYSAMPSCATAYSSGFDPGGNSNCCTPGASVPNKEGPRTTPAIISPITCGWCRKRRTAQPHRRQPARITNICRKKIMVPGGESGEASLPVPDLGVRRRVLLHELGVLRQRVDHLGHLGPVFAHEILELTRIELRH